MGVSLYIHIPFCRGRCQYCAFVSSEYVHEKADAYLHTLSLECDLRASFLSPESVYIGGGTPTALDVGQITRLADMLHAVDLSQCKEITVEANPGTVTVEKMLLLRRAGINRVSLGVQTFQPEGLQVLGRRHDAKAISSAVAICREVGIENISLDLIYGWPGQTVAMLRHDLEQAVRLHPEHLSCYGLTYEDGTPITTRVAAGDLKPVPESTDRDMFDLVTAWLPDRGYEHYEISNFARHGHECRHNRNYWIGEDYVGLGAGAFSYQHETRFANTDDVDDYILRIELGQSARYWEETLEQEKRARELAVIWLRMREGIDPHLFHRKTGCRLEHLLGKEMAPLLSAGWLERSGSRLRLTSKALPVADSVLSELIA